MSTEKVEQLRKLVLNQLETIMDLYGDEITGSDLDFTLRLAIKSIKDGGKANAILADPFEQLRRAGGVTDAPLMNQGEREGHEEENDWDEDEYGYDEPAEMPVPEGFENEAEYDNFVQENADFLPTEENEYGEVNVMRPDSVFGVKEDAQGNIVEIGNLEENAEKLIGIIEEENTIRDEETGEVLYHNRVEAPNEITIKVSRQGNQELTERQVLANIIGSPVSRAMLDVFGEDYRVEAGDSTSEKLIVFTLDQNDEITRNMGHALTNGGGMVAFGGRHPIPGLGLITAQIVF